MIWLDKSAADLKNCFMCSRLFKCGTGVPQWVCIFHDGPDDCLTTVRKIGLWYTSWFLREWRTLDALTVTYCVSSDWVRAVVLRAACTGRVCWCLGSEILRLAEADRSRVSTGTLPSAPRQALLLPRRRQHWNHRAARQRQRHASRLSRTAVMMFGTLAFDRWAVTFGTGGQLLSLCCTRSNYHPSRQGHVYQLYSFIFYAAQICGAMKPMLVGVEMVLLFVKWVANSFLTAHQHMAMLLIKSEEATTSLLARLSVFVRSLICLPFLFSPFRYTSVFISPCYITLIIAYHCFQFPLISTYLCSRFLLFLCSSTYHASYALFSRCNCSLIIPPSFLHCTSISSLFHRPQTVDMP